VKRLFSANDEQETRQVNPLGDVVTSWEYRDDES